MPGTDEERTDRQPEHAKRVRTHPALSYFLASLLLWVVVDLGTAGGFRLSYWAKFGPTLLIFYLGYPLAFTYLVFSKNWSEAKLFVATLVAIFIVEVVFTRNPLLTTFPACLIGIPLAVAIYAPLTFFPLWFVRREMGSHKVMVALLALCEIAVMTLTTIGGKT